MLLSRERLVDGVATVARLGLAAVWLISGAIKLADPGETHIAVQAYEVLPQELVGVVATAMPLLEIILGLFLLAGLLTRVTALVSVLVLLAFIAAVVQAWARGLSIDCGCFGGGGQVAPEDTAYPQEIAKDIGFLILAGWLLVHPRTWWSADGWLATGSQRADEDTRKDLSGRSGTDRTQEAATEAELGG